MNQTSLATAHSRRLGRFAVKPIGLGCMNLSHAYGAPPSVAQRQALLRRAIELGVDCVRVHGVPRRRPRSDPFESCKPLQVVVASR